MRPETQPVGFAYADWDNHALRCPFARPLTTLHQEILRPQHSILTSQYNMVTLEMSTDPEGRLFRSGVNPATQAVTR
jgi:hypothetical protein